MKFLKPWSVVGLALTMLGPISFVAVYAGDIHNAARKGELETVRRIIDGGVDINHLDGEGQTAMIVAAKYGRIDIVDFLLEKGAEITHTGSGPYGSTGSALHIAVKRGKLEVARLLLEAGADPNQPDAGVGPPLHVALKRPNEQAAELLREFGAAPLSAPSIYHLIKSANLKLGKEISVTCQICHNLSSQPPESKMTGPTLWNVVGRPKASVDGYAYSQQIKDKGGIWDYQDLNSFLSNPRAFIPGTNMTGLDGFADDERRAALIAYLRTLSEDMFPLE